MLLKQEYKDDAMEGIRDLPDAVFADHGVDKAALLADGDKIEQVCDIDRIWALYQKALEDYGESPDEALRDALETVCGIPAAAWDKTDGSPDGAMDLSEVVLVWEDPADKARTVTAVAAVPAYLLELDPAGGKLLEYLGHAVKDYAKTAAGAAALRPRDRELAYMDILKVSPAFLEARHIFLVPPDEALRLTMSMDQPIR